MRQGQKHTLEARRKISKALRGRKLSPAHCQKIGDARRGKKRPEISEAMRGKRNPNWKGGRNCRSDGYIYIKKPDHPRAYKDGYVREHRFVMEQHLGRYLESWEIVHHKNGIKDDNRLENLELLPKQSEHLVLQKMQAEIQRLEAKARKWKETYFRLLTA